ncbi:putative beta-lysine N-acetyltransferase [Methanofollis aquaemaris]|uniref:Beta-lysine N-acetyltransferase n=1 Tax=Methanofollis aquaemaris TaxID=126734 RepID=A0A8A3S5K6_9EURY|nr:putative beta-lysine N-acetyltransferase [Methanofollis aquaemaris]QSZ66906.1 putative beta-lysine N-acetyltransferase [Methanofollis aquaemaris]
MSDVVVTIGKSRVQHGPANNRVYLIKLNPADSATMPDRLLTLAREHGYTKVFCRVHAGALEAFLKAGYQIEAQAPELFRGVEDGYFLSYFLDPTRERIKVPFPPVPPTKTGVCLPPPLPPGYRVREAGEEDAGSLAALYKQNFETYPFPIDDPAYIISAMREQVRFFVVEREQDGGVDVVGASSAEMDPAGKSVEMTDMAISPSCRGLGLSVHLLHAMEAEMRRAGMIVAYTISRAAWEPVNRLFASAGYRYGGTMVNNTQICGRCESMHLWYRRLDRPA